MTRLFLLIGLLHLSACKSSPTKESTPLTYEKKTDNFQECMGGTCAKVDLIYPVFEGDTVLSKIINRHITGQNMQMWVTGDQQYGGMEDAVASFFESYKDFRTDFPDAVQEWTFETVAEVTYQADSVISIKFDNFSYLGGAHPNTVVAYLNLDLSEKGTVLTREKMMVDREKLMQLGEEKFREHHEVEPAVSLEVDGRFFLDDGRFFLPFAMGYEGNEFILLYNSYEIGPYAMGRTELRIPLADLEGVVYLGNK